LESLIAPKICYIWQSHNHQIPLFTFSRNSEYQCRASSAQILPKTPARNQILGYRQQLHFSIQSRFGVYKHNLRRDRQKYSSPARKLQAQSRHTLTSLSEFLQDVNLQVEPGLEMLLVLSEELLLSSGLRSGRRTLVMKMRPHAAHVYLSILEQCSSVSLKSLRYGLEAVPLQYARHIHLPVVGDASELALGFRVLASLD
jgi:hypothetical protein